MKQQERKIVFDKFDGRCAYCGCELTKGWHVDEIEPIRRNWKVVNGRKVFTGCQHPERLTIENQNPSCPSCNINKHSEPLEQFRKNIAAYMKHLNEVSTQYKIAKRYGLVEETGKPVLFYFETLKTKEEK